MKSKNRKLLLVTLAIVLAITLVVAVTACKPKPKTIDEILREDIGKTKDTNISFEPNSVPVEDAFLKLLESIDAARNSGDTKIKEKFKNFITPDGKTTFISDYALTTTDPATPAKNYQLKSEFNFKDSEEKYEIKIELLDKDNSNEVLFGAYYTQIEESGKKHGVFILDTKNKKLGKKEGKIVLEDVDLSALMKMSNSTGLKTYISGIRDKILARSLNLKLDDKEIEVLSIAVPMILPMFFEENTEITKLSNGDKEYQMVINGRKVAAAIVPVIGRVDGLASQLAKIDKEKAQDVIKVVNEVIGFLINRDDFDLTKLKDYDLIGDYRAITFRVNKAGEFQEIRTEKVKKELKTKDSKVIRHGSLKVVALSKENNQEFDTDFISSDIKEFAKDYIKQPNLYTTYGLGQFDLTVGCELNIGKDLEFTIEKLFDNYKSGPNEKLEGFLKDLKDSIVIAGDKESEEKFKKVENIVLAVAKQNFYLKEGKYNITFRVQTDIDFKNSSNNKALVELEANGDVIFGAYLMGTEVLIDIPQISEKPITLFNIDLTKLAFAPLGRKIKNVLSDVASKGLIGVVMGVMKQKKQQSAASSASGLSTVEPQAANNYIKQNTTSGRLSFGGGKATMSVNIIDIIKTIIEDETININRDQKKIVIKIDEKFLKDLFEILEKDKDEKKGDVIARTFGLFFDSINLELGLISETGPNRYDYGLNANLVIDFNNMDEPDQPSRTKAKVGLNRFAIIASSPDSFKARFEDLKAKKALGFSKLEDIKHVSAGLTIGMSFKVEDDFKQEISGVINSIAKTQLNSVGLNFESGYNVDLKLELSATISLSLGLTGVIPNDPIKSVAELKSLFADIKEAMAKNKSIIEDITFDGLMYIKINSSDEVQIGVRFRDGKLKLGLAKLGLPNLEYDLDIAELFDSGTTEEVDNTPVEIEINGKKTAIFVPGRIGTNNPIPNPIRPNPTKPTNPDEGKKKLDVKKLLNIGVAVFGGLQGEKDKIAILFAQETLQTLVKLLKTEKQTDEEIQKILDSIKFNLGGQASAYKNADGLNVDIDFNAVDKDDNKLLAIKLFLNKVDVSLGVNNSLEAKVDTFFTDNNSVNAEYLPLKQIMASITDAATADPLWTTVSGKLNFALNLSDKKLESTNLLGLVRKAFKLSGDDLDGVALDFANIVLNTDVAFATKINIMKVFEYIQNEDKNTDDLIKMLSSIELAVNIDAKLSDGVNTGRKITLAIFKSKDKNDIYIYCKRSGNEYKLKLVIDELAQIIEKVKEQLDKKQSKSTNVGTSSLSLGNKSTALSTSKVKDALKGVLKNMKISTLVSKLIKNVEINLSKADGATIKIAVSLDSLNDSIKKLLKEIDPVKYADFNIPVLKAAVEFGGSFKLFPTYGTETKLLELGADIKVMSSADTTTAFELLGVKVKLQELGAVVSLDESNTEINKDDYGFSGLNLDDFKSLLSFDGLNLSFKTVVFTEIRELKADGLKTILTKLGINNIDPTLFDGLGFNISIAANIDLFKVFNEFINAKEFNLIKTVLENVEFKISIDTVKNPLNIFEIGYAGFGIKGKEAETQGCILLGSGILGIKKRAIKVPDHYIDTLIAKLSEKKPNKTNDPKKSGINKDGLMTFVVDFLGSEVFKKQSTLNPEDYMVFVEANAEDGIFGQVTINGELIKDIIKNVPKLSGKKLDVLELLDKVVLTVGGDKTVDIAIYLKDDNNDQIAKFALGLKKLDINVSGTREPIFDDPTAYALVNLEKLKYINISTKLTGDYQVLRKGGITYNFGKLVNTILEAKGLEPLKSLTEEGLMKYKDLAGNEHVAKYSGFILKEMKARLEVDIKLNLPIRRIITNLFNLKIAKDSIIKEVFTETQFALSVNLVTPKYDHNTGIFDPNFDPTDPNSEGELQTFIRIIYDGLSSKAYADIPLIGFEGIGFKIDPLRLMDQVSGLIEKLKTSSLSTSSNNSSLSLAGGKSNKKSITDIIAMILNVSNGLDQLSLKNSKLSVIFNQNLIEGIVTDLLGLKDPFVLVAPNRKLELGLIFQLASASSKFGFDFFIHTIEKGNKLIEGKLNLKDFTTTLFEEMTPACDLTNKDNLPKYIIVKRWKTKDSTGKVQFHRERKERDFDPEDDIYNFIDLNELIEAFQLKGEKLFNKIKAALASFENKVAYPGFDVKFKLSKEPTGNSEFDLLDFLRKMLSKELVDTFIPKGEELKVNISDVNTEMIIHIGGNLDMFDIPSSEFFLKLTKEDKINGKIELSNILDVYFDGRDKTLYLDSEEFKIEKIKIENLDIIGMIYNKMATKLSGTSLSLGDPLTQEQKDKINGTLKAIDYILAFITKVEVSQERLLTMTVSGQVFNHLDTIINSMANDPNKMKTNKFAFLADYVNDLNLELNVFDGVGVSLSANVHYKYQGAAHTIGLEFGLENMALYLYKKEIKSAAERKELKKYTNIDVSQLGHVLFGADVSLNISLLVGGELNEDGTLSAHSDTISANIYELIYNFVNPIIEKKGGITIGEIIKLAQGNIAPASRNLNAVVGDLGYGISIGIEGNLDLSRFEVEHIIAKSRVALYLRLVNINPDGSVDKATAKDLITVGLYDGVLYVRVHSLENNSKSNLMTLKIDLLSMIRKKIGKTGVGTTSLSLGDPKAKKLSKLQILLKDKKVLGQIVKMGITLIDSVKITARDFTVRFNTAKAGERANIFKRIIKLLDEEITIDERDAKGEVVKDASGVVKQKTINLYQELMDILYDKLNKDPKNPSAVIKIVGATSKDDFADKFVSFLDTIPGVGQVSLFGSSMSAGTDVLRIGLELLTNVNNQEKIFGLSFAITEFAFKPLEQKDSKLVFREEKAGELLYPFDQTARLGALDFKEIKNVSGGYFELKMNFNIPDKNVLVKNLGEKIANMEDFGNETIKNVKELLGKITTNLKLTSDHISSDYILDVKAKLDTFKIFPLSISSFKKISLLIEIKEKIDGEYYRLIKFVLHNGIAYIDGAKDASGKGGMPLFTKDFDQVKIDLSNVLLALGVPLETATVSNSGSSLSLNNKKSQLSLGGGKLLLGEITFDQILDIVKEISVKGNGKQDGYDGLVIKLDLDKLGDIVRDKLKIDIMSWFDLTGKECALKILKDGGHNYSVRISVASLEMNILSLGAELANEYTFNTQSYKDLAQQIALPADELIKYKNKEDFIVNFDFDIEFNLKNLRDEIYTPLNWVFEYFGKLEAFKGAFAGLGLRAKTNAERTVRLSFKLSITLNDFIGKNKDQYTSTATIEIFVTGYPKPILIATDFNNVYVDASAIVLPKVKFKVDIISKIKDLLLTGNFRELKNKKYRRLSTGPKKLNINIFEVLPKLVEEITVGNQKTEIILKAGDVVQEIINILFSGVNVPDEVVEALKFDKFNMALDIEDGDFKNTPGVADNTIRLNDFNAVIELSKNDIAEMQVIMGISDAFITNDSKTTSAFNRLNPDCDYGDITSYTHIKDLSVNTKMCFNFTFDSKGTGDTRDQYAFAPFGAVLEKLLNKGNDPLFSDKMGLYAKTKGTNIIHTIYQLSIAVKVNFNEFFDENADKTLAFTVAMNNINPKTGEASSNLIQLKYLYYNKEPYVIVEIPALSIDGIKITGFDIVEKIKEIIQKVKNRGIKISTSMLGSAGYRNSSSLSLGAIPVFNKKADRDKGFIQFLIEDYVEKGQKKSKGSLTINGALINRAINFLNKTVLKENAKLRDMLNTMKPLVECIYEVEIEFNRNALNFGEVDKNPDLRGSLHIMFANEYTPTDYKPTRYMSLTSEFLLDYSYFNNDKTIKFNATEEKFGWKQTYNDYTAVLFENIKEIIKTKEFGLKDFFIKQFDINLETSINIDLDDPAKGSVIRAIIDKTKFGELPIKFDVKEAKTLDFKLNVFGRVDLTDVEGFKKNTQIKIEILLHNKKLVEIAYSGEHNALFLDLENLGLMKIRLFGIDIAGFIEQAISDGAAAKVFSSLSGSGRSGGSTRLSFGSGNKDDLSRLEILFGWIPKYGKKNKDYYYTRNIIEIVVNYHLVNKLLGKVMPDKLQLPEMNDITIRLQGNTADDVSEVDGSKIGFENLVIEINLDKPIIDNTSSGHYTGREISFVDAKNKIEISVDKIELKAMSKRDYLEISNKINNYSAISLSDIKALIKYKEMRQVKTVVENVLETLTGVGNASIADITVVNTTPFFNANGVLTQNTGLHAELQLRRDKSNYNLKKATIPHDTLMFRYADASSFDVRIHVNKPNLMINLVKVQSLATGTGLIWKGVQGQLPFVVENMLGALDKIFKEGTGDKVPTCPDDLSKITGTQTGFKKLIDNIEIKIGVDQITGAKSLVVDPKESSLVQVNLNVLAISELIEKIKVKIYTKFGYNNTGRDIRYIIHAVMEMINRKIDEKLPVGKRLAKREAAEAVEMLATKLLPLPNFKDNLANATADLQLLLTTQEFNGKVSLIRRAKLRLDAGVSGGVWELSIATNGIKLENIVNNSNNKINGSFNKRVFIKDPYNFDQNKNGIVDYYEGLPNTATAMIANQYGQFSGKVNKNITLGWSVRVMDDTSFKIDPTVSTVKSSKNKLAIVANAMNYQFTNKNDRRIVELPQAAVRRPKYDSKGNPFVKGVGLKLPLVIESGQTLQLPNIVTVTTANENGEEFIYTFNKNLGDVVVWDTSFVPRSGRSVDKDKQYITLRYGRGLCKDVIVKIPFIYKDKKPAGFAEEIVVNPYEFIQEGWMAKFVKQERDVRFTNTLNPVKCKVNWGDDLLGGGKLSKYKPSFAEHTITVKRVTVVSEEFGLNNLYNVPIKFRDGTVKKLDFTPYSNDLVAFKNGKFNLLSTDAKYNPYNLDNYPKKADIEFIDGYKLKGYKISWDLGGLTNNINDKVQNIACYIGEKNTYTYQKSGRKIYFDHLSDIQLSDIEELKATVFTYDILNNSKDDPRDKKFYLKEDNGKVPDKLTIRGQKFDYSLNTDNIGKSYENKIMYANLTLSYDSKKVATLRIPVVTRNRKIINVIWKDIAGKTSYPLAIDVYTAGSIQSIAEADNLPKEGVYFVFEDGSMHENTVASAVSWMTFTLLTSYLGGSSYILANVTLAGVSQVVRVPVTVRPKIGKFAILDKNFDIDNKITHPTRTLIMFKDGTSQEFNNVNFKRISATEMEIRFGIQGHFQKFVQRI